MLAKFFRDVGDMRAATEFYVIADMKEEAFMFAKVSLTADIATQPNGSKSNGIVDFYAEIVGEDCSMEDGKMMISV
jgi:hypothetical protein